MTSEALKPLVYRAIALLLITRYRPGEQLAWYWHCEAVFPGGRTGRREVEPKVYPRVLHLLHLLQRRYHAIGLVEEGKDQRVQTGK